MKEKEKLDLMAATINPVITLIQKRLGVRLEALNALATSPLDNMPESVLKMREEESAKIRAVMQEQKELIDLISLMYPNAKN
ncbi:MAG: hypothetical protein WC756_12210 [Taibaiella sp.]|jgi:hypothetical protein